MHIAVLSDPNNFHTQKWAHALRQAGARVTVMSLDEDRGSGLDTVRVQAPFMGQGRISYKSYLAGGPALRRALQEHQVDLVNALNVTPFGVWARMSGFRPVIQSALGADILEYPPRLDMSPALRHRAWANVEGRQTPFQAAKASFKRKFHRKQVQRSLQQAQLITGDNQYLVDCIRDWFGIAPERVRKLFWGIEPDLFAATAAETEALRQRWGIRPGHRVVLSPRGAKAIYQGDIILEAFASLLEAGVDHVHFMMLSAGYEVATDVAERARELSQRFPHFTFVDGVLPRTEVYQLWNLVDVFVSAPVYDGYSAALAEGRWIGAVPVVNDIPASRELLQDGETGLFVAPFTPERLAERLREAIDMPASQRSAMATRNRQWIESHSLLEPNARLFLEWAKELC